MRRFLALLMMMLAMAPGASAREKPLIALAMCDLDTARSVAIASDIMDGAEEAGYAVEMASAEHRLSAQISDIEHLTEARPEYLVVVAVKAVGLRGAIRAAAEKGSR